MKRRHFLRQLGLGASSLALSTHLAKGTHLSQSRIANNYSYGKAENLADARNDEGYILVRLALATADKARTADFQVSIKVKGAEVVRARDFFMVAPGDEFNRKKLTLSCQVATERQAVVVLWLNKATDETSITFTDSEGRLECRLRDLIDKPEAVAVFNNKRVVANLLLSKEVGKIKPEDAGIKGIGNTFSFTVMADPQGGDAFAEEGKLRTRMRIHNAFVEESVALANRIRPKSAFTVVVGDVVDAWGYAYDFRKMNEFLGKLEHPVLYEIGNHETEHHVKLGPGYNMEGFNNYFSAQKAMNGLEHLLYSFDLGQWHFIIWPDPLRDNFWETHPHYFDWLERDLEAHQNRPTMVFHHVPAHPIGISPHISYAESVPVKRLLLNTLSKYGNVKYVLSGHVHIPVKSSMKTAVSYRGMQLINIPAAGFRPRAFGEQDYLGGPSQGIGIVDIDGKEAKIMYKTVSEEEHPYPATFPAFDEERYALWLNNPWELSAKDQFVNGRFEDGLNAWTPRYVYMEDDNPANRCEVRRNIRPNSFASLYLYARCRDYQTPGQDRLPQDINRISQAVTLKTGKQPVVTLSYMLDGKHCDFSGLSGAYVWIEAYRGALKQLSLVYAAHRLWYNIGGKYSNKSQVPPVPLKLDDRTDQWHEVLINVADDFDKYTEGTRFADLNLDRLVLTFGVWNLNDGVPQPFAAYFDDVKLHYDIKQKSRVGEKAIGRMPKAEEWWRGKDTISANVSGEHRIHIHTPVVKTRRSKEE